jgi:hypothetical protein
MDNKFDKPLEGEFEMSFEDLLSRDFQQSQSKQDSSFETLFGESHLSQVDRLVEPEPEQYYSCSFQRSHVKQEADVESLFGESILPETHMLTGPGTKQELPGVLNDPIHFYRNQQDSITYIFDPNTRRAYPLHPTVAPVTYPQGQYPPYTELPVC